MWATTQALVCVVSHDMSCSRCMRALVARVDGADGPTPHFPPGVGGVLRGVRVSGCAAWHRMSERVYRVSYALRSPWRRGLPPPAPVWSHPHGGPAGGGGRWETEIT